MKQFQFEKQGFQFIFRNPTLDRYNKLVMEYKIVGIQENNSNEGFYVQSQFLVKEGAMTIYDLKVNGNTIKGVRLPDDILSHVNAIFEDLKYAKETLIDSVVEELATGKRNLYFSIVGVDYPHYQPWLRDLPKELKDMTQEIMYRAVKAIVGKKDIITDTACSYIERKINKSIGTKEELGDVLNVEYQAHVQEYHGFKEDVVTGFEMPLDSIMPAIEKANEVKEAKQKKVEEEIAKLRPMTAEREKEFSVEVGKVRKQEDDYKCDIYVTNPERKVFHFTSTNIFDFGHLLVPDEGGHIYFDYDKQEWRKNLLNGEKLDISKELQEAYWVAKHSVPVQMKTVRL